MSLRVRLSIIVSLLFLSGLVLGMGYLITNAKQRVAEEVTSTATLTFQLLTTILVDSDYQLSQRENAALIQRLLLIENARHMDISIEHQDSATVSPVSDGLSINAPDWFVHLVQPEPLEFKVLSSKNAHQGIVIRTNPADEISEVWLESKNFMLVLLVVLAVLNSILYISIGRWFTPVKKIVEGLDDVERGDFSGHIPKASLPELKVIVEKLNRLTSVLRASKQKNTLLTKRSLKIQEEERRYLSQELHDEMGQSLSAINAIAFSISQRMQPLDKNSAAGAEQIGQISNHVRDHVRSMMSQLRPAILDELGLIPALQQMVDDWNEHHKDIFCSISIVEIFESLDSEQKITIYRIVQEALTNVVKHSGASEVKVQLTKNGAYQLLIEDNGAGFDTSQYTQGLGLSGIKERVDALSGSVELISEHDKGLCIHIVFND